MQTARRSAIWDEVWASYDARQGARGIPVAAAPPAPPRRTAGGTRAARWWTVAALLPAGWLALSGIMAASVSDALTREDAPEMIRWFDGFSAPASLRAAMGAAAGEERSEGARRFLSGMGERMAAAWERPEELSAWMALRARGGRVEEGVVPAVPLRAAWPSGPASLRLEYGPEDGGVTFDVAWRGDGFRVTGVSFPGIRPGAGAGLSGAAPAPGRLLAMR